MYHEYDQETIQRLHKVQMEMIKDFQSLCSRHDIPYFAVGGTLLGAVRHKGFIPWDDDVDLGMLRQDYDRLIRIGEEEYADKYILFIPEKENHYYNLIPKFVLRDSLYISEIAQKAGINNMGIFLEIFVFEDVIPARLNWMIIKVTMVKMLHFEATCRHRIAAGHGLIRLLKLFSKYLIYMIVKLFAFTPEKTNALYLKQTIGKQETGVVTCFGDHTTKDVVSFKGSLVPALEVPFEDGVMKIPKDYDALLKQSFGNYMELPPIEKRENQAPVLLQFPGKKPQKLHD